MSGRGRGTKPTINEVRELFIKTFGPDKVPGTEERAFIVKFFDENVVGILEKALKKRGRGQIDYAAILAPAREKLEKLLESEMHKIKKTPWCLVCQKEGNLECCSGGIIYCSEACQHIHWAAGHQATCTYKS